MKFITFNLRKITLTSSKVVLNNTSTPYSFKTNTNLPYFCYQMDKHFHLNTIKLHLNTVKSPLLTLSLTFTHYYEFFYFTSLFNIFSSPILLSFSSIFCGCVSSIYIMNFVYSTISYLNLIFIL